MLDRFTRAVILAARAHDGQVRKGSGLPYIHHPMAVANMVAEYGGDQDQQIASVLHDVIEDGGTKYLREILEEFGPEVLQIVLDCTDALPGMDGKKAPWRQRKQQYLAELPKKGPRSLLVVSCDKLFNSRAINADLRTNGLEVFNRFAGKIEGTLWYYRELARALSATELRPAIALNVEVEEMRRRVARVATEDCGSFSCAT